MESFFQFVISLHVSEFKLINFRCFFHLKGERVLKQANIFGVFLKSWNLAWNSFRNISNHSLTLLLGILLFHSCEILLQQGKWYRFPSFNCLARSLSLSWNDFTSENMSQTSLPFPCNLMFRSFTWWVMSARNENPPTTPGQITSHVTFVFQWGKFQFRGEVKRSVWVISLH
jgi:hypothetical protein